MRSIDEGPLMSDAFGPIRVPDSAWRSGRARRALQTRDIAGVLRVAQQYTGVSQHRLANAVGILQGRVSEILKGNRTVTALDVFERIADGLCMPDYARLMLGLAPRRAVDRTVPTLDLAEILDVFPNQAKASDDIRSAAAAAATIDVLAVRGLGLVGLKDSLLRDAITRADKPPAVTVLLGDPDCAAIKTRAQEIGESADAFAGGIRYCIDRLAELRHERLRVYLYDGRPVWRLIGIDDTLYVSAFADEREGHQSPTYKIVSTDGGALYQGFRRTFDNHRDHAIRKI